MQARCQFEKQSKWFWLSFESALRSAEGGFAPEVASLAHWTSSCCIFFDQTNSKEYFYTTTFAGKTILSEDRIFYTSTKQVGWVWDMIRMKKVLPLLQSSFLRLSSSSIQICFSEVIAACIMASSFGSEMGGCILLRLRPHQRRWKLNNEERFASEGKACSGGKFIEACWCRKPSQKSCVSKA